MIQTTLPSGEVILKPETKRFNTLLTEKQDLVEEFPALKTEIAELSCYEEIPVEIAIKTTETTKSTPFNPVRSI